MSTYMYVSRQCSQYVVRVIKERIYLIYLFALSWKQWYELSFSVFYLKGTSILKRKNKLVINKDIKDPRNSFKCIRHKLSSADCSSHAVVIQEVCGCFGLMKITTYYGTLESDISVSGWTRKPEDGSLVSFQRY